MRKIFAFLVTSVDGYHETNDGDLSWHNVDGEFLDFAVEQLAEADTLLFGRKTYEHMAAFWPTDAGLRSDPAIASRMNGYDKIVVSGSLSQAAWGPTSIISDNVAEQLTKIKDQPGKHIALLGSSELTVGLLRGGVVDEIRIMVSPVLLGSGHPVLGGADRTGLELLRIRQFASGNVLLTYAPSR